MENTNEVFSENVDEATKESVDIDAIFERSEKAKKRQIIGDVVIVVLVIVGVFFIARASSQKSYSQNMQQAVFTMSNGIATADSSVILIGQVWYNSIYQINDDETNPYTMENGKFVDDFNKALSNLYADEDFIADILEIENNKNEVIKLMKKLQNPPKKYEDEYSMVKEFYDNYILLCNMALNPNGNYTLFEVKKILLTKELEASFEKLRLYVLE